MLAPIRRAFVQKLRTAYELQPRSHLRVIAPEITLEIARWMQPEASR
jgi:hypothetical protein